MKVALINPPRERPAPADFPPIGLGYLGGVAAASGHEVSIIDAAGWRWDELRQAVADTEPDVTGVTCWTIERGQAFKTANTVKEVRPDTSVVVGGPHASAFPGHVFLKTSADFVVMGEGEETFRELLDCIDRSSGVSEVDGIAYRDGEGFTANPRRALIRNLDDLPFPLHSQFNYSGYRGLSDSPRRAAAIITSRGCPFRCAFCSSTVYWGHKYRKRSVENVIDEIKLLYHQHGIRALLFFDDNLVIDRQRCIALSKAICDLDLDLIWASEGSVKVDREMLEWMKKAGCYRIDFGVESGSPQVLKNINKAFTVEDTRSAFRLCAEVGIKPNAYLMIGAPGETKSTVRETIRLMKDIQPAHGRVGPGVWILPDTTLYEKSLKEGVISEEDWLSSDKTFVYTGEHSFRRLVALAGQFERGMAWNAGIGPYLKAIARQIRESPEVDALRSYAALWGRRIARLITDPRGLWISLRKKTTKARLT